MNKNRTRSLLVWSNFFFADFELPNSDVTVQYILSVGGQFHQHFMNSFCANILSPKKLQTQTVK